VQTGYITLTTGYIVKYLEVNVRGLKQMMSRLFLEGTKKNYKKV
jgi:hypothetical protein